MFTKRIAVFFAVLWGVMSICFAEESAIFNRAEWGRSVYFPQFQLFQTVKDETELLYPISGKLIVQDECLRIVSGNRNLLLVWPGWYRFEVAGREITVKHLKQDGWSAKLKPGDAVAFTGAELENNPINLQFAIPAQCPGPYWAVGEIETVKSSGYFGRFHRHKGKSGAGYRNAGPPYHNVKAKKSYKPKDSSKELINMEIQLEDSMLR